MYHNNNAQFVTKRSMAGCVVKTLAAHCCSSGLISCASMWHEYHYQVGVKGLSKGTVVSHYCKTTEMPRSLQKRQLYKLL